MIAWKPDGIPTVSSIGSDRNNLSWTVNQASGSTLLVTVTDSQGFSGGESPYLYTVSDGDSSCLPSPPSTNITLAANLSTSDPLETCELLGLRVFGGQKPYTISIAAVNSPVVTNVTLGGNDDVLTWPNRADPDGQVMASVSDANGVWGTSTGLFKTTGQAVTDQSCTLSTQSGNSANVDQNPPQPSKSHAAVIAGVIVPVVVLSLLAGLGYYLWRKRQQKQREPEPAFLPDAWMGPSIMETGTGVASTYSPYDPPPSAKLARYRDEMSATHSRTSSSQNAIGMGFLSPAMPGMVRQSTFDGHSGSLSGSYSHTGSAGGGKSDPRLPPGVSSEWTVEPEIVIQHQDAGAVQEIPPPYQNHSAAPAQSTGPAAPTSSAGLSVVDSSTATSRPSSSGDQSAGSSAPLHPTPTLNKGKGKATDLLT